MDAEYKIGKLISDELDAHEREELIGQIEQDKDLQKTYKRLKIASSLSAKEYKLNELLVERSFLRFKESKKLFNKSPFANWYKYAAIIVLTFSLGVLARDFLLTHNQKEIFTTEQINELIVPNG